MLRKNHSNPRLEVSKLYRKLNNLIDIFIAKADEEELQNLLFKLDELYVRVEDGIKDVRERPNRILSPREIHVLLHGWKY